MENALNIIALIFTSLGVLYTLWLSGRQYFLDLISKCVFFAKDHTWSGPNMNLLAVKILFSEKFFITYQDKNVIFSYLENDPFEHKDNIFVSLANLNGENANKILKELNIIGENNEKGSFLRFLPNFLTVLCGMIVYFLLYPFSKKYRLLSKIPKSIQNHIPKVNQSYIPNELDELMRLYGYDESKHAEANGITIK